MQNTPVDPSHRRLLSAAAAAAIAGRLGAAGEAPLQQVEAGPLSVGYAEAGRPDGPAVLLLHGWPYDIHIYAEMAPLLAAAGYLVVVPYLRGYGTRRFLSDGTARNGQQSALAADMIALPDAPGIRRAVVGGCDWGPGRRAPWPRCGRSGGGRSSRSAAIRSAAPRPTRRRCRPGRSSPGGTSSTSPRAAAGPVTKPTAETSPGASGGPPRRAGPSTTRPSTGPRRPSTTRTMSASWSTTIAGGSAAPKGEQRYDALEPRQAGFPPIGMPTITLEGDANGAPHPEPASYADRFTACYAHRLVASGIGHNLPQEALREFT